MTEQEWLACTGTNPASQIHVDADSSISGEVAGTTT